MNSDAMADMEVECYKREMRKRPQVSSAATQDQNRNLARNKRNRARHGYRTRAAREEEQEEDEAEVSLFVKKIIFLRVKRVGPVINWVYNFYFEGSRRI